MRRLRRSPIAQALVRPTLWLGCDPVGLMVVAGLSALIGLGGWWGFRVWWMAPLGLALFWAGRKLLLSMAAKDPQYLWVYLRALAYDDAYDARSRWDVPSPTARRWA